MESTNINTRRIKHAATVFLIAACAWGLSACDDDGVIVPPPQPLLDAAFNVVTAELEATFIDVSSADGEMMTWSWDFGDGTTSTEQHPVHRYAAPGTYRVTLTVADDSGLKDTVTVFVKVVPEDPCLDKPRPADAECPPPTETDPTTLIDDPADQ